MLNEKSLVENHRARCRNRSRGELKMKDEKKGGEKNKKGPYRKLPAALLTDRMQAVSSCCTGGDAACSRNVLCPNGAALVACQHSFLQTDERHYI